MTLDQVERNATTYAEYTWPGCWRDGVQRMSTTLGNSIGVTDSLGVLFVMGFPEG